MRYSAFWVNFQVFSWFSSLGSSKSDCSFICWVFWILCVNTWICSLNPLCLACSGGVWTFAWAWLKVSNMNYPNYTPPSFYTTFLIPSWTSYSSLLSSSWKGFSTQTTQSYDGIFSYLQIFCFSSSFSRNSINACCSLSRSYPLRNFSCVEFFGWMGEDVASFSFVWVSRLILGSFVLLQSQQWQDFPSKTQPTNISHLFSSISFP